jgi:hypothetical protein
MADSPEPSAEAEQLPTEQPLTEQPPTEQLLTEHPPTEPPLPWADLLDGDLQQPLRVSEYNRTMEALWAQHNDQYTLRLNRRTAACNALGSDMEYLRGWVPRQIEAAHRQMAPFQTKGLSVAQVNPSQGSAKTPPERVSLLFVADPETANHLLEWLRSEEESHRHENYRQLFSHFLNLNLDDYLDSAQDDRPLSRSEFIGYIETLSQKGQDPTGRLEEYERFLEGADLLIQDLLTMLREVRRSLAMLEATKAHGNLAPAAIPKQTIMPLSPSSSQLDQPITQSTDPTIELEDAIVTRRDFLLAMLDLIMGFEPITMDSPVCGGYWVEGWDSPARPMQREVNGLIRDLDILNMEIMELVNTRSR